MQDDWNHQCVRLRIDRGVAELVLTRPQTGNRLDAEMARTLADATDWLAARPFRVLLLRAEGDRFCVGGAIDAFAAQLAQGGSLADLLAEGLPFFHHFIRFVGGLRQPVVSAVQGAIGGGGIGLALCADLVLAGHDMKLRGGYVALGLTPDLGTSWQLARLAGPRRAAQILMTNRAYDGRECLAMGLISELVAPIELEARAGQVARSLADGPAPALARIKRLVAQAREQSFEQHLDLEETLMRDGAAEPDAVEGVRAFMERRPPRFSPD